MALARRGAHCSEISSRRQIAVVEDRITQLSPKLRTASNAAAMLTQTAITGTGSMSGMAVAAGNLAQSFAAVASSARIAAAATGIGAVVTIVGVVIGALQRARDEADQTAEKFETTIAQMINAGDVAAMRKRAQDLFVGTPAEAFKDGIRALEREQQESENDDAKRKRGR